jgi:hypothetical protein
MSNKAVNLKEEKERLMEERAKNPEPMVIELSEIVQLKLKNFTLERAILTKQLEEIDVKAQTLLSEVKKETNAPEDWQITVNLQDLTKAVIKPKE